MRIVNTLIASLLFLSAQAQWPTDPNNPLLICDDASNQQNIRVVADGTGGWYVLWTDDRIVAGKQSVFGQRVNDQGIPQWEPNGRLIQEVPGRSINFVGATRLSNGNLFLAYISGASAPFDGDTVRAMAYDTLGAQVWATPVLLAYPGPLPGGGTSGGNYYPRVAAVLGGAYVGWGTNPAGAADYIHIARVKNDGTTDMPVQGVEVSSMNNSIVSGPWTFRHDLVGGLMIERRWGNGAGAPLRAMRVDSMGTQLWPSLLEVSANSTGLGYEWSTAIAPRAGPTVFGPMDTTCVWPCTILQVRSSTPLHRSMSACRPRCRRTPSWCNPWMRRPFSGRTTGPKAVVEDRSTCNASILLAFRILPTDGVLAMQVNGNNIGYPRALPADNGSFILTMHTDFVVGGGTPGFRAGLVTMTGSNLWSDTTRFCIPSLGPNGGTDYALVSDGDGGAAAFWFNWQNNAIYAARLDRFGRMGDFTSITENKFTRFRLFPNPATDRITLQSSTGQAIGAVRIHAADGRVVREAGSTNSERMVLDIQDLPPGLYTVVSNSERTLLAHRFIKQ